MSDWPTRQYIEPQYLPDYVHYILMAIVAVLLAWKADEEFGWSHNYGDEIASATTIVPGVITPILVIVVEAGEGIFWGLQDAFFGESQQLFGLALAAIGVVALSQREASDLAPRLGYHDVVVQLLGVVGFLIISALVVNA